MSDEPQHIWEIRATLGEGPIWLASDGCVWFVDIKQKRIHRLNPQTNERASWSAPAPPGFLAPLNSTHFLVGLQSGLHRFDPATGSFSLVSAVEQQPNNRLNDGYVDAKGRLWFGSMDDGERTMTGVLYRMARDGRPIRMDDGYCITNGPCLDSEARTLYHTCTLTRTVYVFDVSPDGAITNKRIFLTVDPAEGHPDGSIVDAEGCIWIALWGGWRLQRYSPKAEPLEYIELPCANVTKAAFGGSDLRTLYITTAAHGLSPEEQRRQPMAGDLFSARVSVPGQPQHRVVLD